MKRQIRWGMVGAGRICHRMMEGFRYTDAARVQAVYARDIEKGQAFCRRYGIPRYYSDVDEMLKSGEIDLVYVALPHQLHFEVMEKAIERRIPVLCEKPITPTAGQARRISKLAASKKVFLMEAMWTRFFPVTRQVKNWICSGAIGKIKGANGIFAFKNSFHPADRVVRLDTAGGALLDIGVYLVSYLSFLFERQPEEIATIMNPLETGVDGTAGIVFRYPDAAAAIMCSLEFEAEDIFTVYGETGRIEIAGDFWRPHNAKLIKGGTVERIEGKHKGEGFQYEIEHVAQCLLKRQQESEIMPLRESVEIADTMQKIRNRWGLKYPFEK